MRKNIFIIRSVIITMCLSIVFCIGRMTKRNSYVSEYSLKDTINTKIDKVNISRYKGDSIVIINQRSEDFIVFLTDSCNEGARCYKITKSGVKPLVYLATEYENGEIKTIYYSEDDVKLISIEK